MTWYDEILSRFRLARRQPQAHRGRWVAYCPVHEADDGHRPSLGLEVGSDGSRFLVRCRSVGCAKKDILRAVGLTMRDLFEPQNHGRETPRPPRRIVAEYDYLSADGELLYQNVRYEPKDFRARRPDGAGYWVWNLDGVALVPYRLPHILARPNQPVVIVEGEKDADALADAYGIETTTGIGGTGIGWLDSYSVLLAGRRVAVIPDADAAGIKHAERVMGSLIRHGCPAARWVEMPPGCKDVSDALAAGVDVVDAIRSMKEYRR